MPPLTPSGYARFILSSVVLLCSYLEYSLIAPAALRIASLTAAAFFRYIKCILCFLPADIASENFLFCSLYKRAVRCGTSAKYCVTVCFYTCIYVCLFVCLHSLACILKNHMYKVYQSFFSCSLSVVVTRSSSDDSAIIHYVLPVLWILLSHNGTSGAESKTTLIVWSTALLFTPRDMHAPRVLCSASVNFLKINLWAKRSQDLRDRFSPNFHRMLDIW